LKSSKVTIIILNWNGKNDTVECIKSLNKIRYPNYKVVIVDNGSTDDSVSCFKEKFPQIKLIETGVNLGFSGGNNVGIKYALETNTDFVLLLNNDTVVDPRFLDELIKVAESEKDIGILSPFVYWFDNPDEIQNGGEKLNWFRFKSTKLWELHPDNNIIECENGSGACMLIKRSTIEKIGLMSEDYFLLLEDVDFYQRALKHDLRNLCIRSARIWHKTSRSLKKKKNSMVVYKIRNWFVIRKKYLSPIKYRISVFLFFVLYGPLMLMASLYYHPQIDTIWKFISGIKEGINFKIENV
jgi:GT2 family glycosyltransferase